MPVAFWRTVLCCRMAMSNLCVLQDGSALNFLNLFDDFLAWKSKAMAKDVRSRIAPCVPSPHVVRVGGYRIKSCRHTYTQDIETHLYPHIGVDEITQDKIDEFNYEHYTLHPPSQESDMPLKFHEAAPCIGKRVATLHLSASSDTEMKLIWSGNTWVFRDAMDEHNIKGAAVICVAFVCHVRGMRRERVRGQT